MKPDIDPVLFSAVLLAGMVACRVAGWRTGAWLHARRGDADAHGVSTLDGALVGLVIALLLRAVSRERGRSGFVGCSGCYGAAAGK